MSYTSDVKREMLRHPEGSQKTRTMELAGILACAARIHLSKDQVSFSVRTDSPAFARYLFSLIEELYGRRAQLDTERSSKTGRRRIRLYVEEAEEILRGTGILEMRHFWYSPIFQTVLQAGERQKRAFLRGCFLAAGTLASPEKSYHLEMSCSQTLAETILELLEEAEIFPGVTPKRRQYTVYIKDSEQITDFLRLIGAHQALLSYENVRINKEIRNEVNRQVNAETANLNKTVSAARAELKAIEELQQRGILRTLAEPLRRTAELRLQYPDESIAELMTKSPERISRSTLHRRLKKLIELTEEIRERDES